ncbi:hypothetical protein DNTS_030305 [Danionella cerebrum]|uniref:PH domain-containing protein n=1 Tax=Danionella cerebrum TaxID=2873325 RepID=A0A553RJW8_9TELE|nr:hypothetical protein DNTS_030305 [Danionella translucida]
MSSSESWFEPRRHTDQPAAGQRKGAQQIMDVQGQSDEEEEEIPPPEHTDGALPGCQLLYQIPNNKVLTTKIGLLNSLREYDRVSSKVNNGQGKRRMMHEEFFPVTFRMDLKEERENFFNETFRDESSMWICKPTGLNQGRGIFLLQTLEDITGFRERLEKTIGQQSNRKLPFKEPQARIVQWYIRNPLLLKGRKFDVRCFFLIACTTPYMVFFRHGYVRLTCNLYDPNSKNITAHLTNQFMQKKNPLYSLLKEETVWSMKRFNDYINETYMVPKGLPKDWALGHFTKRMQQIIIHCFQAVKGKLDCKLGFFDLIGCDFLVDEDFKVWLLEMNCNPALHTNCEVLKDVIPQTSCSGVKLLPLESQRDFQLLYSGESMALVNQRNKSTVPYSPQQRKIRSTHKTVAISIQTSKPMNEKITFSQTPTKCDVRSTSLMSNPSPHPQKPERAAIPGLYKPQESKPSRQNQIRLTHARVELPLSKCTWQNLVISNLNVPQQPLRNGIMSMSTSALDKCSNGLQKREAITGGSALLMPLEVLRARVCKGEAMGCCSVTQRHTGIDEVGPDEIELLEISSAGLWTLSESRLQISTRNNGIDQASQRCPSVRHLKQEVSKETRKTHYALRKQKKRLRLKCFFKEPEPDPVSLRRDSKRQNSTQPIKEWEGQALHNYGEIIHSSSVYLQSGYTKAMSERYLVLFSFHLLILALDSTKQIFIYEGLLPLSAIEVHLVPLQDSTSLHMFEIQGPMVDSKVFICAGATETKAWIQNIEDRRYKSIKQQLSPSHSALSYLIPCDENWKREELKRYLMRTPISQWEGIPIQHMGYPKYLSLVNISNIYTQSRVLKGPQERLLVLFSSDLIILSLDSHCVRVRFEGRLPLRGIKAMERSALTGRLEFELAGELMEPLLVSCIYPEDYQSWIFQLQQPEKMADSLPHHTPPPLVPKKRRS